MISSNVQSKRELFYLLRIVFPNLQFGAAQAALLAPGVLSDLSRGTRRDCSNLCKLTLELQELVAFPVRTVRLLLSLVVGRRVCLHWRELVGFETQMVVK